MSPGFLLRCQGPFIQKIGDNPAPNSRIPVTSPACKDTPRPCTTWKSGFYQTFWPEGFACACGGQSDSSLRGIHQRHIGSGASRQTSRIFWMVVVGNLGQGRCCTNCNSSCLGVAEGINSKGYLGSLTFLIRLFLPGCRNQVSRIEGLNMQQKLYEHIKQFCMCLVGDCKKLFRVAFPQETPGHNQSVDGQQNK